MLERVPVTPMIGRGAELDALTDAVPSSRLTTVVGPGGVGKTRLVADLVGRVGAGFRDGVTAVWLADIRDPGLLDTEVAAALMVARSEGGQRRALLEWLDGRETLLVLDNAEHLVDAVAELVADLTARLPRLRVLVTSREPLLVPGETVFALAPLPVPAEGHDTDPTGNPCVRLFLDRMRARDRTYLPDAAAHADIGRLCRRLDGLPLALELAAARAGALGVHAVTEVASLGGVRGVQHRHTSLRAVFEWSNALLEEPERMLLRRLSVFADGFSAEALRAVVGGAPLPVLARLVDKSLVVGRGPRWALLETVREFAAEQLDLAGETELYRGRHAEWFRRLAGEVAAGITTGPERPWLQRLTEDDDNVRLALDVGLTGSSAVDTMAVVAGLPLFWWASGRHQEGIRWLRTCLERCPDAPTELVAATLFGVAFLWAHDTDDWQGAARHLDRARELVADTDAPILGYVLCLRGEAHAFAGEHAEAERSTRAGLAVLDRVPDPWGRAFAVWNLGFALQCAGDTSGARACYEQMVRLQEPHGSRLELMIGWNSLAELAERDGDHAGARQLYTQALQMRRELVSDRLGFVHGSLPGMLVALARCAAALGDASTARAQAVEAFELAGRMRDADTAAAARRVLDQLSPEAPEGVLVREGQGWRVGFDGHTGHVADAKGLRHLHELLGRPGTPVAATRLVELDSGVATTHSDAGPILDRQALDAYRRRLGELATESEAADRAGDAGRSLHVERERQAVIAELSRATGLGGRARRANSGADRARLNVTRTLRDAVDRIRAQCPHLAEHLDATVRTGFSCVYEPTRPVTWTL